MRFSSASAFVPMDGWGVLSNKELLVYKNEPTNKPEGAIDLARFMKLPVYFFDLESVHDRAGTKLELDRERVVLLCEQQLLAVTEKDTIIRSPDGFYLIVQSATGEAADTLADLLNAALLGLLFGTDSAAVEQNERLFRRVPGPGEAAPRTQEGRRKANASRQEDRGAEPAGPVSSPNPQPRDAFSELALRGVLPGQNVELVFRPVHDLIRGRSTTFFCSPAFCIAGSPVITGYRAFEGLSPRDFPFLDRAILAHSLKFARRLGQAGVYVAIGAPVNFETLVWSRGREIYSEALRAAGVPNFPFVVLTIRDVPIGTTASKLAELIASIRPLAKRIFVHLPNVDTPVLSSGHLGADGFILSLPPHQRPTQVAAASWLTRMCETQTALSCIDQIDDESALEVAKSASVRFGQGTAFGSTEFRGSAAPIDIEVFMRTAARASQGSSGRNVHRLGTRKDARDLVNRLN